MSQVHYNMYTRKLVRIMSLPPTYLNLFVHFHFQMLLWNAADYLGPLDVSISEYGRENMGSFVLVSIKPTVAVPCETQLPHLLLLLNRRCVPKLINQERGRDGG